MQYFLCDLKSEVKPCVISRYISVKILRLMSRSHIAQCRMLCSSSVNECLHLFVSYSFVRTGYVSTTSSIETCTGKKNIIKATCKLVKGATYQVVKLIFLLERQSIEVNKKKKWGKGFQIKFISH